jgi:hypothetical protein
LKAGRFKNKNGIGLGLYICKHVCNAMGGDINISSNEDKGSTFTFSFRLEDEYVEAIDGQECSFGISKLPIGPIKKCSDHL